MEYIIGKNELYVLDASNKRIAEITYPFINGHTVNINHTFVDPILRGQGVAAELTIRAYQHLKEQGLKAVATCPYVVKWFEKNIDKQDILDHELQKNYHTECLI